jgi:uncharacterized OB-fold protein
MFDQTDFIGGDCNNCGMRVPVAKTCPYCKHEHTPQWQQSSTEISLIITFVSFVGTVAFFIWLF